MLLVINFWDLWFWKEPRWLWKEPFYRRSALLSYLLIPRICFFVSKLSSIASSGSSASSPSSSQGTSSSVLSRSLVIPQEGTCSKAHAWNLILIDNTLTSERKKQTFTSIPWALQTIKAFCWWWHELVWIKYGYYIKPIEAHFTVIFNSPVNKTLLVSPFTDNRFQYAVFMSNFTIVFHCFYFCYNLQLEVRS